MWCAQMITFAITAIAQPIAIMFPATSARPGEPRDQQVVHRDGREEQQVDDRVAEEPEHVLREQRVDGHARRERLDHHLDEQDRERDRRDDHVERDHRQRDHGVRHRPRVGREPLRREVAEAERDADPVEDVPAHRVQRRAEHRVEDRRGTRARIETPARSTEPLKKNAVQPPHSPAPWNGSG